MMRFAKRATVLLLACSIAFSSTGCFSVQMASPIEEQIYILPDEAEAEVKVKYQKWFALWGIFPLTETDNPRDIIQREKLVEVRVATEDALEDIVAGIFFTLLFPVGIILPQTIIVEGNRQRTAATGTATKGTATKSGNTTGN